MKMKEVRAAIEDAEINVQFKKLADHVVANGSPIDEVYKKWKKKLLIFFLILIIPGIIYFAVTKNSLDAKIRNAYKDNIKAVIEAYAEKHPEVAEPEVTSVRGQIDRVVFDPAFNELKRRSRKEVGQMNWGNTYQKQYHDKYVWDEGKRFDNPKYKGAKHQKTSIFDDNKMLLQQARINMARMGSGRLSEAATGTELGVIAFDLSRYALTTKVGRATPADSFFERVYLRTDLEAALTIKGVDVKFTNYISLIKCLVERKTDDGKTRISEQTINGIGGLMFTGTSDVKLKGDIVLACKKNLLAKPEGPFLGVKLEKDPFESIDFNRNYELAVSKTFDQISLFKRFSARLVNKLDELREQFPGFAFSVKKDGTFCIMIGAYMKNDVPFSLDRPGKFAKDKEYAANLIKSDLIYLNSAVTLMGIMNQLGLINTKDMVQSIGGKQENASKTA